MTTLPKYFAYTFYSSQAENSTKQFTDSSLNTTTDTLSGGQNNSQILCTDAILEATFQLLNNSSLFTRLAALRWITVLAEVCSSDVFSHVDRLLPEMLKLVSDPADEVSYTVGINEILSRNDISNFVFISCMTF